MAKGYADDEGVSLVSTAHPLPPWPKRIWFFIRELFWPLTLNEASLVHTEIEVKAVHDLKVWPEYFDALLNGRKQFEIRKNDRDYRLGDALRLKEYDIDTGEYTGRELWRRVVYILRLHDGLRQGYVVMGLADANGE